MHDDYIQMEPFCSKIPWNPGRDPCAEEKYDIFIIKSIIYI